MKKMFMHFISLLLFCEYGEGEGVLQYLILQCCSEKIINMDSNMLHFVFLKVMSGVLPLSIVPSTADHAELILSQYFCDFFYNINIWLFSLQL